MTTPTGKGRVRAFDSSTWWGEVETPSAASPVMKFHGTCFLVRGPQRLPEVGEEVTVVFSDEAHNKIVAIRAGAQAEHGSVDSDASLQAAG